MRTSVLANLRACRIHDVAWPVAEPLLEKSGCVPVRNEADVMAVRLVGDSKAAIRASARTSASAIRRAESRTGEVDVG